MARHPQIMDDGLAHQAALPARRRKAHGIYYTPAQLVDLVVQQTLAGTPQSILDPACGSGAFLSACRDAAGLVCGIDTDEQAVAIARQANPAARVVHGNALLGPEMPGSIDWQRVFPEAMGEGGFDVVIGNPPWGQKAIAADDEMKAYLWRRFPSSIGIFDWFRPFIELSIQMLKPGGRFGMVLPDIILLKDYPETRRYLLDHLAIERIEWWGQAFTDAAIDVVTLIGTKQPAAGQRVTVAVHDADRPLRHSVPQDDFRANPRHVFNLRLTAERRRVLERLAACPRLGDHFEMHEGVHSGNLRAELFVATAVDASCAPLLFGGDEIQPYRLKWAGRYLRRAAAPTARSRARYANLGQPEWHRQPKVLVRRTGDHVLAAVDELGRWASNNFFLVFPKQDVDLFSPRGSELDLHGLCALLNSRFMTWYFRAIEPRQGRAFAELKIKHLRTFPLPTGDCNPLNDMGRRGAGGQDVQAEVDALVPKLFDLDDKVLERMKDER